MVVGRHHTTSTNPTSIFRRNVSDSAAIQRYNSNEDDDGDKRDASDKSSSYGEAFFVVDMENDMCEEVSHLSDPTSYMLTTPSMQGGRRIVKHKQPFATQKHHGKRRLSATSLLKKPIAALVKHNYFGGHHKKNQLQQQQKQQENYLKRGKNNSSKVSPVEDTSKASPSSNQERVPLTLLVPLGGNDTNYNYGTLDLENRNPRSSPDQQTNYLMDRNQPPSTALQLHQDASWEDDRLLLFDDSTPRTPMGLGAFQSANQQSTSPKQKLPKVNETMCDGKQTPNVKLQSMLGCRKSPIEHSGNGQRTMTHILLHRWEAISLCLSVFLLVLAVMFGVSPATRDGNEHHSFIDLLFWAVTTFTTIGPASAVDEDGSISIPLMVLTILYALLGVTTLGVVWGRYGQTLVSETMQRQSQEHDSLRRHAMSVFCGPPSHRGNSTTETKIGSSHSFHRTAMTWKAFGYFTAILVLTALLGVTLEGNTAQALYYAFATACALGDNSVVAQSPMSKVLLLILIPLLMAGVLWWLTTIASWIFKNAEKENSSRDKFDTAELMDILHTLQLEDGLLTRADFLEILLLSMKKVDQELILALREGFQKVTHFGSLDLTRAQLIESAVSALAEETNE